MVCGDVVVAAGVASATFFIDGSVKRLSFDVLSTTGTGIVVIGCVVDVLTVSIVETGFGNTDSSECRDEFMLAVSVSVSF